jgi:hypothetical protein
MASRIVKTVPSKRIEFDPEKFRELMLYVAERSQEDPSFGATKLNKVLYFSDFLAYEQLGRPITGAVYQRLEWGPAPHQLLPEQQTLIRNGDAELERRPRFNLSQRRLVPRRKSRVEVFSDEEREIVDQVIDALRNYTAVDVSSLSHKIAIGWQLTEDGEEIPYYTAFLTGEPPSEDAIEWAQQLAAEHGWNTEE